MVNTRDLFGIMVVFRTRYLSSWTHGCC